MGRIPKRWLPYQAVGECITGTRFVAFKVPLRDAACRDLPEKERFTLQNLVEKVTRLGLVIDLTNTDRYYNPMELKNWDIDYAKIYTEGQRVPNTRVVKQFFQIVDEFLEKNADNGKLIGVHCTHGVNRTGYLVCRYMVDKLSQNPAVAIKAFHTARGHKIERQEYIDNLITPDKSCSVGNTNKSSSWFPGKPSLAWFPGKSSAWTPDVTRPLPNVQEKSGYRTRPERSGYPSISHAQKRYDSRTSVTKKNFNAEVTPENVSRSVSSSGSFRRRCPEEESSKKRKSPTQLHRESFGGGSSNCSRGNEESKSVFKKTSNKKVRSQVGCCGEKKSKSQTRPSKSGRNEIVD